MMNFVSPSHQSLFDTIFEYMPSGIAYVSLEGKWLLVNPKLREMLQYSWQELQHTTYLDLTLPEDRAQDRSYVQRFLAREITGATFEKRYLRKDGSIIWTHMTVSLVFNTIGVPSYFTAIIEDIETYKRHEKKQAVLYDYETHARERAEVDNEKMRVLQTITDHALAHLSLDDLLKSVLRRIREIMAADNITILLLNEERTYLTIRAVDGIEEVVANDVRIPLGRGFAGTIAARCQPLIGGKQTSVEILTPILREQLQSLLGVPLMVEERVIGVIHIGTKQMRTFTRDDIDLFERVADRLALAIEHSLLLEQTLQARAQAVEYARELEAINEQLEQASKMQRTFVSIIGHEIRTPLTAIQGFSELLRDDEWSVKEVKEFASDISLDAQRLNRIISELLDLERMKSGRMSLNVSMVPLNTLLRKSVMYAQASTRKHTFTLKLDDMISQVKIDEDKLTQVMTNLLSNAIKYSPDGGDILIASQLEDGGVHVYVQDYGIGVSAHELEHLFTPFYRVESAPTRYIKGTGLGLPIVKEIIELHAGQIWVESTSGQGSTFHVSLPFT